MQKEQRNKKKKRMRRQEKMAYASVGVIVVALVGVLSFKCLSLYKEDQQYGQQIAQLQQQKEEQEQEKGEIENYKDYVNTDAYTIQVARDKLGLVFPGETIFRSSDSK
jgi:cell division protein DivIC